MSISISISSEVSVAAFNVTNNPQDARSLVVFSRASWALNDLVEERVAAMPWSERFHFDHGREPCIDLPEDLQDLNAHWN